MSQRVTPEFIARELDRMDKWCRHHQGRPLPPIVVYQTCEAMMDKLLMGELCNTFLNRLMPADIPEVKAQMKEMEKARIGAPKNPKPQSVRGGRVQSSGTKSPSIERKKHASDLQ